MNKKIFAAAGLLGGLVAVLPSGALATVSLTGPGGKLFDIQDTAGGDVYNGTSDAYDGAYTLTVNGTPYSAGGVAGTMVLSGRGVMMASQTSGSLVVQREAWVPATGLYDYIRYYDSIENTSSGTMSVTVQYMANLGSDSSTQVTATSSGDMTVDIFDHWFCTDDGAGGDPSLAHVWFGESASATPASETLSTSSANNIDVQFRVDIPAGGRAGFVIFGVQANDSLLSQQAALWLSDLPLEAQEGLESDRLGDLVNWGVAGAPRIRFTASDYTLEEGGSLDITVEVEDPEGDPVAVTWDLDGDAIYDDGEGLTATLSGIGIDGPSMVEIGVKATDGTNERIRRVPVTVENVLPEFLSDPAEDPGLSLHRGQEWFYQIQVQDQANAGAPEDSPLDRLVVTVTQKPAGMIFAADLSLSWSVPRTDEVVGDHPVTLMCDDGDEGVATQEFILSVLENTPPGKPTILSPKEETVATLRPQLRIQNAVDNEGDSLTYLFDIATLGTFSTDSVVDHAVVSENPSGETTWTVSKDLEDGRRYYWRVRARDDQDEGPATSTFFQIDLSRVPPDADASDASVDVTGENPLNEQAEACSCSIVGEQGRAGGAAALVLAFLFLAISQLFLQRRQQETKTEEPMRKIQAMKMTFGLAAAMLLAGCSGGQKGPTGPRTDLKPFKEISAVELFEKVFKEHGYKTSRDRSIYIVGYGPWQVDLWVEGDKLPLVVEYLTADDREKLGEHFKSSKVGDKFKLVAVAIEEVPEGGELNRANSRFAVIFDDRDYVFQPNPKSEDRYEVTIFEIENRMNIDITDVIEELQRVMAEEAKEAGKEEKKEGEEEEDEEEE